MISTAESKDTFIRGRDFLGLVSRPYRHACSLSLSSLYSLTLSHSLSLSFPYALFLSLLHIAEASVCLPRWTSKKGQTWPKPKALIGLALIHASHWRCNAAISTGAVASRLRLGLAIPNLCWCGNGLNIFALENIIRSIHVAF